MLKWSESTGTDEKVAKAAKAHSVFEPGAAATHALKALKGNEGMRHLLSLCLGGTLILMTTSTSNSQIKKGFEIGVYGGSYPGSGAGGIRVLDRSRSRFIRSEIENGLVIGFRGAYHFNPFLGIEVDAGGTTNDHIAQLYDLGSEAATEHTNALFFAFGNGVVHLLKGRVAPYVSAGAGGMGFVDQGSPAFNYGGGLKLFLNKRFALRIDAREVRVRLNGTLEQPVLPPGRREFEYIQEHFSDKLRFKTLSGGFSVVF